LCDVSNTNPVSTAAIAVPSMHFTVLVPRATVSRQAACVSATSSTQSSPQCCSHRHSYSVGVLHSIALQLERHFKLSARLLCTLCDSAIGSPIAVLRHLSVEEVCLQDLGIWTHRAFLKQRRPFPHTHTVRYSNRSTQFLLHTVPVQTHRTADISRICWLS